ncbi:LuxR C-terminal-related transcriptional regulator [Streptomyces sp. NPDC005805]|uniref:LuxR C-terminal-related transcriptional regulator n=1 Tax=Streptomyces sp. NPDC005805 TaxID=3157068 RepID=UPI0033D0AB24
MGRVGRETPWPLIGRDREQALFAEAWSRKDCRAILVHGPAGVGKSRLAAEFLTRIPREHRWEIGRATATSTGASVPLGAIAHLIPAEMDPADPVQGFAAVARALAGPDGRRWVFLVDDLQLLDSASTVLLGQLIDSGAVRLVATVRSGERLSRAVSDLMGRGDVVHRIDLAPLDALRTDLVLRAALGAPVGRRSLTQLHEASGGNILYLRELVIGAWESGRLTEESGVWELRGDRPAGTPRLMELIAARISAVGQELLPVLELLALCGLVPLGDARAVASADEDLHTLEQSGIVTVHRSRRRVHLELAHPLYAEALRDRIPRLRRSHILLRQVERTRAHGSRRRNDPLNIATWELAATGSAAPDLLVRAAGLARYAHDHAQVVSLLDALPEDHRTTGTHLLAGEAYSSMQRFAEAEQALALADLSAVTEQERIVAARTRAMNLFISGRRDEAIRVAEDSRTRMDTALGRRTSEVTEGAIRALTGEPQEGVDRLRDLSELERALGDPAIADAWTYAVAAKANGLVALGRVEEAIRISREAYDFHGRHADVRFYHPTAHFVAWIASLSEAGRIEEARHTANEAIAQSIAEKAPVPLLWLSFWAARNELVAGHYEQAAELYSEVLVNSRNQNSVLSIRLAASGLAAAAAALGDTARASEALAHTSEYPVTGLFSGEERIGEAWLLAAEGNLVGARAVLLDAVRDARATGHVTSEALVLTDIARLGAPDQVAGRLTELAETSDGGLTRARADFARALASGRPEPLLEVSERLAAIGAEAVAAEAAAVAGGLLRRAGAQRNAAAAFRRAGAYRTGCPGVRTPLLSAAEESALLTPREREISLLAAAGTPSREIAEQLTLSVRTVNNHLQNVYTKLGVGDRRELRKALRGA